MDEALLEKIMVAYGVPGTQFLGTEKGYRNSSHHIVTPSGEHLNLIIYKREPGILERIRRTNRVADYTAGHGLPARCTADQRILRLQAGQVRYAALYAYLPGATIPWEAYTMRHIKLLGKTMSDMHAALATMPPAGLPHVTDEYIPILQRMGRYFSSKPIQGAVRQKLHVAVDPTTLTEMRQLLARCCKLPGQQALHMDFVRGNILFNTNSDDVQVSGILDFEKTAYGHPLFDVARTLAFLIVDCKYKQEHKIRKYFLQSGYSKRGIYPLKDITIINIVVNDISMLERLVDMFLLYDFYKFLRHNPYEFLPQNEHFMRTKQILINRNIIRQAEMVK